MIDQQDIEISKNSIRRKNGKILARSFRSLVTIYTFLKFLVFWSTSYHECYKHKDIIVPTKYVIDQQDIEISKNSCLRRKNLKISARSLRSLVIN